MSTTRRKFISASASGLAVLSAPGFLAGCTKNKRWQPHAQQALPDNPFMTWFGVVWTKAFYAAS